VNADTEPQVVPGQPRLTNERSRTCPVKVNKQRGKDDRTARRADIRIRCNPRRASFRRVSAAVYVRHMPCADAPEPLRWEPAR
jgi:hypothetical protein